MKKRPLEPGAAAAGPTAQPPRPWGQAWPILLVVGCWLLLRPYRGIVHDARLYVVQALRRLDPEIFDRDIFFAFGSQDDFTLFSRLFAPLIDAVGVAPAALLYVVVGQAIWLAAAAALSLRLAQDRGAALVGLLLLAGLPGSYGGWQLLTIAEPFASPRLLAEGLALWALWALTGGRLIVFGLLAVASASMHPIMSSAVVAAALIFLILRDRRWLMVAAAGALLFAVAAYLRVGPFGRILETMDAEWLETVQRNIYLFPSHWESRDWSRFALSLSLGLASAATSQDWRRKVFLAVVVAALLGVAAMHVGADILHNVLLLQMQVHRAMWLLNVVAYIGGGMLLVRIWNLKEDGHALTALLAFTAFLSFTILPAHGAVLFVLSLTVALLRLQGRLKALPHYLRPVAIGLAVLLGIGLLAYRLFATWQRLASTAPGEPTALGGFGSVSVIDVAVIAVALLLLLRHRPNALVRAMPAAAVILCAVSVATWDRRDAWAEVTTGSASDAKPAWVLPADAQVFWENDPIAPWFMLRRASYVSTTQGGGIVFVRDTAMAYRDRIAVVQPLMQIELIDVFRKKLAAHAALPELERETLASACARDPELDAMVLSREVRGSYAGVWDTPRPIYDEWRATRGLPQAPIRRYYLYLCRDLRDTSATADAAGRG